MDTNKIFELILPEMVTEGISPPFRLRRSDRGNDRYYYKEDSDVGYLSMTSFVSKSLPTSPHLVEWIASNGVKMSEYFRDESADYGTAMHMAQIECIKNKGGSFEEIEMLAREQAALLGHSHRADLWAHKIVRDVASFLQFLKDYQVKPLAAEIPVASDKYGLAGCLDLPCRMQFNKKEVTAIVDMKSGRKGFFEGHEMQLHGYKVLWNDWFGHIAPVTHVFNWAPSDWKDKPTYKLKNQTKSVFANSIIQRMEIAKLEEWVRPPSSFLFISGEFDIDTFDIDNHLLKVSP